MAMLESLGTVQRFSADFLRCSWCEGNTDISFNSSKCSNPVLVWECTINISRYNFIVLQHCCMTRNFFFFCFTPLKRRKGLILIMC